MPLLKYYEDKDSVVSTEVDGQDVHLHITVSNWTPSVLKNLYKVFVNLEDDCHKAGFSRMITYTPNPKFAHLFGGDTAGYTEHQGKQYEVVIWELKHS